MFQRIGQPEDNEANYLECFEPREVPFWRVPAAIIVGIWITAILFIAIYFLGAGLQQQISGDFRPIHLAVPIIVGIISIAVGVFSSIVWYNRKL
ncbi:hypothetical protein ACFLW8_05385 [Chloroflexota bacterium]